LNHQPFIIECSTYGGDELKRIAEHERRGTEERRQKNKNNRRQAKRRVFGWKTEAIGGEECSIFAGFGGLPIVSSTSHISSHLSDHRPAHQG